MALQSVANMLHHNRQHQQAQPLPMAVQVRKFHPPGRRDPMPAGGATTRLETLAGHPKVLSQDKAENGSVFPVDEESGASSYDDQIWSVFQQDVFTIIPL